MDSAQYTADQAAMASQGVQFSWDSRGIYYIDYPQKQELIANNIITSFNQPSFTKKETLLRRYEGGHILSRYSVIL